MPRVRETVDAATLNGMIDAERTAALQGARSRITSFDAAMHYDLSPKVGLTAKPTGTPVGDGSYTTHYERKTSS